jgi:hypothetical protein
MTRAAAIFCIFVLLLACASVSPRARIQNRFVEFGVSEERAKCLAKELDKRLDRGDLADVADFIGSLNEATSAGGALDALLGIENASAASAIVPSSVACAFNR